ncbi:hypothetical protein Csp1_26340 [Corynebacterium provencense]|uniref:Uncharacterized protein n=1 Tax=Corynebacterium provencense TaxID=1737425 RepID=A0A2Z3YZ66_9CORY|nr:hypothetical protein [Corynebacterium provencense]AWT27377.1 hypothetical protein Csp1_26340 [Corynebacterium provencense]
MTFRAVGKTWSTAEAVSGDPVPLVTSSTVSRKSDSRSCTRVSKTSALRRRPHVDQACRA